MLEIHRESEPSRGLLTLRGTLDAASSEQLLESLEQAIGPGVTTVVLDLAALDGVSSPGLVAITDCIRRARDAGADIHFRAVPKPIRDRLEMADLGRLAERGETPPSPPPPLELLGGRTLDTFGSFIQGVLLVRDTLFWTFIAPLRRLGFRWGEFVRQIDRIGVRAIPIVSIIAFLIGLILAIQAAYQLRKFGATAYIADLVGISLTREIAPLISAILLAGRTGSSITAEIGTMMVTEEVDALKAMGLSPIQFLVAPKHLAALLSLPGLVIIADAVGILGGAFFVTTGLGVPLGTYLHQSAVALYLSDIVTGLIKSVVFGHIVVIVGVFYGFRIRGGAEGVGIATTQAVVLSIVFIVLTDLLFTALFYIL